MAFPEVRKLQKDNFEVDKVEVNVTETALQDVETESVKQSPLRSKYIEVQSAVDDEEDDFTMPAETFRAYAIGIIFTLIASAISNVTDHREQPLCIDPAIIQLIAYPVGRFWGKYFPDIRIGFGRMSFKLNPGPFTVKEHTLITAMANVGVFPPYAVGLIIVQINKYGSHHCSKLLTNRTKLWVYVQLSSACQYRNDRLWTRWHVSKVAGVSERYDLAWCPSICHSVEYHAQRQE